MDGLFGKLSGVYLLEKTMGLFRDEEGQTLVEYALILALIAIVVMIWLSSVATGVNNTFSIITSTLP